MQEVLTVRANMEQMFKQDEAINEQNMPTLTAARFLSARMTMEMWSAFRKDELPLVDEILNTIAQCRWTKVHLYFCMSAIWRESDIFWAWTSKKTVFKSYVQRRRWDV